MRRIRYQVAFYTNTGVLFDVHDLIGVEQMRYSRVIGDVGKFLMTMPIQRADARMKQKDALARVMRTYPLTGRLADEAVYLLRYDDKVQVDRAFIVEGDSAERLLNTRLFRPADDPLVANGFSTKSGPCATVMREIVVEQCISPADDPLRTIPGFSAKELGSGDTSPTAAFRKEIGTEKVLDVLQTLRDAHQIDFWVEFKGIDPAGYPKFEFVTGRLAADRSKASFPNGPYVYLSPRSGNLANPQLTTDSRDEGNYVYVLGPGANGQRQVYPQSAGSITDSPFNRCEFAVEASQAKTLDDFLTAANEALKNGEPKVTFAFEPLVGAEGAEYEVDFDLGTIVTVGDGETEQTMRIVGIEATMNAGREDIKVTAEVWES